MRELKLGSGLTLSTKRLASHNHDNDFFFVLISTSKHYAKADFRTVGPTDRSPAIYKTRKRLPEWHHLQPAQSYRWLSQ
jgi:hypothetical protein